MKPRSKHRSTCGIWAFLMFILVALGLVAGAVFIPNIAWRSFGAPAEGVNTWQRFSYSLSLALHASDLLNPVDLAGSEQEFVIEEDESVASISDRLQKAGLIRSADTFRIYLVWTGSDTIIRSGTYRLSPAQSGQEIANALKSTMLTEVNFTVFPGWRLEEIAASIPTSGLEFTPAMFVQAATFPVNPPSFLPSSGSSEGFLSPGVYTLPRSTSADQLVYLLLQNFSARLTPEMQSGFAAQGLSLYEAVTLASIVQREAMVEDEMPVIASVFYNRLAIGMPLQTDPTVQYALGYNGAQGTWWTNPLSSDDLLLNSPYNTYLNTGLPPGPISSPGIAALNAVANPAKSNYFYFQARCDNSGRHNFAETLEQHYQNNCQ
jgi:UPF0755 protein